MAGLHELRGSFDLNYLLDIVDIFFFLPLGALNCVRRGGEMLPAEFVYASKAVPI